jgi:tRNA threonylcarbamoyladenosine biosynthesis protein TsaE
MKFVSGNTKKTIEIARTVASQLRGGEVMCLYGDLGAGKTTFMQGLISYFLPGKRVLSPTFIIVRHYEKLNASLQYLFHADLYRLGNENEIRDIGLTEHFGKKDSIVAIEWAEKLGSLLPQKRMEIRFEILDETARSIEIKNFDLPIQDRRI